MSRLFSPAGESDFCSGGSLLTKPKEASLFLTLGRHFDLYFPPSCKRARVSAPIVLQGNQIRTEKKASIDVLPDECLFEILRRLPGGRDRSACACVSKRWLMLASNISSDEFCCSTASVPPNSNDCHGHHGEVSGLSADEDMEDGFLSRTLEGKKVNDVRLAAIAIGTSSQGGLGKLIVRGNNSTRGLTSLGFRAIARCCPSLKTLSISNLSSIGDEGLLEIANGCSQLEKLDLNRCSSLSDRALVALAKNCPNLTDINIDSCPNLGNESLQSIGQYCPNLRSIAIKDCPRVGDQGVASLVSQAGRFLSKLKLQSLDVTDVSLAVVGHYGLAMTDLILTNLCNVGERGFCVVGNGHGLQKLRSVAVTSCQGLTDLGLEALANGCPNLKQICLRKCVHLSDSGLLSFAKAAASVDKLQLEECHRITQRGFLGLLIICGETLKSLSLINCLGLKDFAMGSPRLSSCSSLRSLCVRNCLGFGNSSLAMLGRLCPKLQHIEVSGSPGITDAGLLPLLENCDSGLVKVNFSKCTNLSDKVASAVARMHGWTLEVLNLEGCRKVSDASLLKIAENCPLLNDLDVSMTAITDCGVAALAEANYLNLQILSLSGCSQVSTKCLPSLKKLGNSLSGLNIQRCNGISRSSVDFLVEQLWRCDILY
ncbi:hypothetical protein MLD38_014603 [Melastoma candidum]|uniref:Uncharacterized protein n=1 Tax=Melastoma candidum TaxID=119954 RepID=A0ACB9RGE9_9MYRT|nr:hypothetical protein MLD38_014603 [Melastoma candidum]